MRRIILLVEGDGDRMAVPFLLRKILHDHGVYRIEIASSPTKVGDTRKFGRPGELEKHLRYADLKLIFDSIFTICRQSGLICNGFV